MGGADRQPELNAPPLPAFPNVAVLGTAFDLQGGTLTLSGGAQQIVAANPRRVALMVYQNGSFGPIQIFWGGPDNPAGLVTVPADDWQEILWLRHGPLVQQPWFATTATLGSVVSWTEVILRGWQ